jgi:hypothetical protein
MRLQSQLLVADFRSLVTDVLVADVDADDLRFNVSPSTLASVSFQLPQTNYLPSAHSSTFK